MESKIFNQKKPESNTGYLLWQISNLRQRKINALLNEIEITYPQFIILAGIQWLSGEHKIVNQVLLIDFTKMDKSVVSSILKLLEKKEIVLRNINPNDTRAKTLALSKKGSVKLEEAMKIINQMDIDFFDKINLKIDDLNAILIKILKKNGY